MNAGLESVVVARDLLQALRAQTSRPDLVYAETPQTLTGGRDTLVFRFALAGAPAGLGGALVARVFPRGPRERADFEAAVQRAVAVQGYPAPAPLALLDLATSGAPVLVMELAAGRPLVDDLRRPGPAMLRVARTLATSHAALHRLDAQRFLEAVGEDAGVPGRRLSLDFVLERLEQRIERCSLALQSGLRWLQEQRPPDPGRLAICHGDFHPGNILVEGREVTGVIDWPNAVVADPAYDVGQTRHLLLAAPTEALPAIIRPLTAGVRRYLARAYTASYRRLLPLDAGRLRYFEALAALNRLVEGTMSRRYPAELGSGWKALELTRRNAEHFSRLTGVVLPDVTAHELEAAAV